MPVSLALAALLSLTLPAAEQVARGDLLAHRGEFGLSEAEVRSMVVARSYLTPSLGLATVWLQQTASGLPVEGATLRYGVDREGRVRWRSADALVPGIQLWGSREIGPEVAVVRAAEATGTRLQGDPVLEGGGALAARTLRLMAPGLASPAEVEAVVLPSGHAGWRIQLEAAEPHDLWTVLVDATLGEVASRERRVFHAQDGLVFNGQHPDTIPGGVPQSTQSFGITPESPSSWLFAAPDPRAPTSQGNNCDVKEDWLNNNETAPVGTRADGGPSQSFNFFFLNSWATASDFASDLSAAITNAFYWTNRWHDITYALGFDEAAGNCQASNFGKGGAENDHVYIDVHNGASAPTPQFNVLSSVTVPVDGGKPRMTLYLWDGLSGARADAAFDADVILHELTHILVSRLVGGPATSCVTGTEPTSVTEGIADFFAANQFASPVIGEYISGDAIDGIRDYAVDTNVRDYCDFSPTLDVYQRGGILATVLWELRSTVGGPALVQLLVDSLKLVPCSPTFPALRDALVGADLLRNAGANRCRIWSAFLRRGVGYTAIPGGGINGCDLVFSLPACSGEAFLRAGAATFSDTLGNNDGLIMLGETIQLTLTLSNLDGAATAGTVSATLLPLTPGIAMVSATQTFPDIAALGSGQNPAPFQFRADPGYVCGSPITFDVTYQWTAPNRQRTERFTLSGTSRDGTGFYADDAEGGVSAWTATAPALISGADNHTPAGALNYTMSGGCWTASEPTCPATRGPCDNTCAAITSPTFRLPADTIVALRFWARYNLQTGSDALLAELSLNDGASWTRLPLAGSAAIASTASGCALPSGTLGLTGPTGNAALTPWAEYRIDLAAWADQDVRIRIIQHLNACVYFEGAYVDDLALVPQHCQAAPFSQLHALSLALTDGAGGCSDNDGLPDPAETVRIDAEVVNLGSATATGAAASLESANVNLTGLPSVQPLGDLAPGAAVPASFTFSVIPLPSAACNEDARLELRYTTTLPSSATVPVPALLRTDPPVVWLDNFEGALPVWTATLGPQGTMQDWAVREIDCLTGTGSRFFWATQLNIVPSVCGTGEPDYSNGSDSVLTSPPIDLAAAGSTLKELSWSSFGIANTVEDGFSQVLVDHDNDGLFTSVATANGGFGAADATGLYRIDLSNPPDGTPLPAAATAQTVKLQFRFRSRSADPGNTANSGGWIVNNVRLTYLDCPQFDCSSCDPPPVFAGVKAAVDLDDCAASGVEVSWDPAPFGPQGGSYTVWRDGVPIATGISASPLVTIPGDAVPHRYKVTSVTAQCSVDDGNTVQIFATDADGSGVPPVLGNVVLAVKAGGNVQVSWADSPSAQSYSAARSDTRDFAAPLTIIGTPTTGTPGATDAGAVGSPGIATYRVATVICGVASSY